MDRRRRAGAMGKRSRGGRIAFDGDVATDERKSKACLTFTR